MLASCAVELVLVAAALAAAGSPLHDAASEGAVEKVRSLVAAGADLDAQNEAGLTPLLQSILEGRNEIAALLVESGADVDREADVDARLLTAIGAQADADERPRLTPLMLAVFLDNRAVVELLVRARANVNVSGDEGFTPLHVASFSNDPAVATLLLDAGADVEARTDAGTTPLHEAARQGDGAVTELLLSHGADVNALSRDGRTPLDLAHLQPDASVVKLLRGRGAVSMQHIVDANVEVMGANPRLAPLVSRATLERIVPPAGRPLGLALDAAGRKLFWTDFDAGVVRGLDLDRSGSSPLPVENLPGPIGLAFDPVEPMLFWTSDGAYPRRVQRARADGSDVSDVVVSGFPVNRPFAIAVDSRGRKVYWTEAVSGRIRRTELDGSEVEDIVTSGISDVADRPDAREFKALGIAVDEQNEKLYWTEMLDGAIVRADLDGSHVATVVDSSRGLELPAGIAVLGDRLYWADAGAAKIQRADLDGTRIQDVLTANDGLIEPFAIALDRRARRLYWTDASAGTVNVASLEGTDVRTLFPAPPASSREESDASPSRPAGDCGAAHDAGQRYVSKTVNAIGTCLAKVDGLKAVWRRQADAARAAPSCLRQFARLGRGRPGAGGLEDELRVGIVAACPSAEAGAALARDDRLGPLLDLYCKDEPAEGDQGLDCVVAAFRDAALSAVALRYRRAAEWLAEIRPFMASLGTTETDAAAEALRNLDSVQAALGAMRFAERAPGNGSSARVSAGAQSAASVASVSATGQSATYAAVRAGAPGEWRTVPDDGALRSGSAAVFRDNADGTITDVTTGLMWEKKCEGCGGLHDAAARYPLAGRSATVSAWLAAVNSEGGAGHAGYSDWRLPTIKELQSIVDYELFNPAVGRAFDGAACGLGCAELSDVECTCTAMSNYWSATPLAESPDRAFAIGFHLGLIGDFPVDEPCSVRAVRTAVP